MRGVSSPVRCFAFRNDMLGECLRGKQFEGHDLCFENMDFSMEARTGLNSVFQAESPASALCYDCNLHSYCAHNCFLVRHLNLNLLTLRSIAGTDLGSQDITAHPLPPSPLLGPPFGVFFAGEEGKVGILPIS